MSRLVLIDGNAILHRAYHAIPHLTDKKGRATNALYGFISILLNLITNLRPTHLTVCFDEKEKTFRKKDFAAYQAKRPPMDERLSSQIGLTKDFLKSADILFYSKGGYEADDIIGTLVKQARVDEIIIITGDRDIFQLITDKVRVFTPTRGREGKLWGREEVKADFDFEPIQMIDYKALVGDTSDNYPGVFGIGPKTARDLIVKYQTIENIYQRLGEIDEKTRVKLEKGKKEAFFFHQIATIFNQVPVNFNMQKCADWNLGSNKALGFMEEMGFKSLLVRIRKGGAEKLSQEQMNLL